MRFFFRLLIVFAALGCLGYIGWIKGSAWMKERNKPSFRTAEIEKGNIRITRNATGDVRPVLPFQVGSFVSGPIEELYADFNDEVTKGQLLAEIDPRIYKAAVAGDRAALASREAEVQRVQAQLQRAVNDEQRSLQLQKENKDFISRTEMDQFHFARIGLDAQLVLAQASVDQAKANLQNSEANLAYTKITSPVDGIVIDRKIEPGQTLAAQFQAPELFVIAPDMKEKMHIFASIDEADIGLIRKAQELGNNVVFKVDAYPNELFEEGQIEQIRLSSTMTQNVVTYPVIVATPNPGMRLLPGMTAELTFLVEEKQDILKVPAAALRYLPENKEYVHPDDHAKLDLTFSLESQDEEDRTNLEDKPLDEAAKDASSMSRRHVWIQDGEKLKAVEVQVGVSDYLFREIVGGDLKAGDKVVVGLQTKP
ncbi:MAG: efflux RND transporter periplasmic adaptor subunit [Fuerstiella sp.]